MKRETKSRRKCVTPKIKTEGHQISETTCSLGERERRLFDGSRTWNPLVDKLCLAPGDILYDGSQSFSILPAFLDVFSWTRCLNILKEENIKNKYPSMAFLNFLLGGKSCQHSEGSAYYQKKCTLLPFFKFLESIFVFLLIFTCDVVSASNGKLATYEIFAFILHLINCF